MRWISKSSSSTVTFKVDRDLLKGSEPMAATEQQFMPTRPTTTSKRGRAKKKKRSNGVTNGTANGKTYVVEKHYGTADSDYDEDEEYVSSFF